MLCYCIILTAGQFLLLGGAQQQDKSSDTLACTVGSVLLILQRLLDGGLVLLDATIKLNTAAILSFHKGYRGRPVLSLPLINRVTGQPVTHVSSPQWDLPMELVVW